MAAPSSGNWKKSDAAQFDWAAAAKRAASRRKNTKPSLAQQFREDRKVPNFAQFEKLGPRRGRATPVARRIERRQEPTSRKRSGFSSVAALASGGLNKREEAFAKSQAGVIKSRFGGDLQKALEAMRREAGRQRVTQRQATNR